MTGPVRLERMRWWHIAALMPVERELFAPEPWTERLFWSELAQVDTRHYLVALRGDEVVGYAGLCDYPDEAFVQTIAVAPAARGTGLGSRLLTALLEEADRRGQRTVSLEVRADNAAAQRLYDRHGFTRTGVRRGYYSGGVDALVLTRRS
ncbi:MAG: Ribosomal-protein-S18p-alanine acetyltransferase [uncultured Frankineae bacterium]|uniref:[Ribosomal protein bS18]-alanine N-acetyltransferase n=1 Tax=uncultured Frankineae bacterium TaxID=437475 RepID=A0A6J4KX18_9ACTN|nr:MAG: Ribosomal-protein-S18p-alanine acetyltransferase [uncultured Frankineae bacterium]